jgi:general stress protein 26
VIMKATFHIIRTFAIAFLLLSMAPMYSDGYGQGKRAEQAEREKLIAAAREIMAAARYCALISLDSTGSPYARTIDPFLPDEHMVVWFATNPSSRKVTQIRRHPQVTLYYFDREAPGYVTIYGTARLVNDPREKAKRWKDEWKAFYPDRAKSYLLVAVTPEKLEVVNEKKGILGDPGTWTPPSVTFKRHLSVRQKRSTNSH